MSSERRPRRRYVLHPFTKDQHAALREAFVACFAKISDDPASLFEERWPAIREAAHQCERMLFFAGLPRRRNTNPYWRLRAAAKSGNISKLIQNERNGLLYGAIRAGVLSEDVVPDREIADEHGDFDRRYRARRDDAISSLTTSDLSRAIDAMTEPGAMFHVDRPMPRRMPPAVKQYCRFLWQLHVELTNRVPGVTFDAIHGAIRGPAVRLFQAALDPVHAMKPGGIRKLFARLKTDM